MARKNKLGNSFYALDLEKHEEKQLKEILKDSEDSGKKYLRKLIRADLKERERIAKLQKNPIT